MLNQRKDVHLQANASSTGDIRWRSLKSLCYCSCWEFSESFIRSWLPIEDVKNKQIKWLEELKRMLSHIVSSRTLREAAKVGALSWKFAHPPTLYLVRWVSEEHTCEEKKTLLQLFTAYAVPPDGVGDIARYTLPFALGTKQKDHHPQLIKIF